MNKKEFIEIVKSLSFPKDKFCIIAGGSYLMYGLKNDTEDIDLKIKPELFNKLKERYNLVKSTKMENLYEFSNNIELKVEDFDLNDTKVIDGFNVLKLEIQRKWIIENKREKDKEKLKLIDEYLSTKD